MTTKQVTKTPVLSAVETSSPVEQATISTPQKTPEPANAGPSASSSTPSNLYISVKTFDVEGKTVGERIVDMYHFGTRNWLQNHHWWAMHNGHCVETNVATNDEITGYLTASKVQLAAKFNKAA